MSDAILKARKLRINGLDLACDYESEHDRIQYALVQALVQRPTPDAEIPRSAPRLDCVCDPSTSPGAGGRAYCIRTKLTQKYDKLSIPVVDSTHIKHITPAKTAQLAQTPAACATLCLRLYGFTVCTINANAPATSPLSFI